MNTKLGSILLLTVAGTGGVRAQTSTFTCQSRLLGDVHTKTVEGVWSLLKRSIIGAYHEVSVKHQDAYMNGLDQRFNNRNDEYLFRDTLLKLVNAERLTYRELTETA